MSISIDQKQEILDNLETIKDDLETIVGSFDSIEFPDGTSEYDVETALNNAQRQLRDLIEEVTQLPEGPTEVVAVLEVQLRVRWNREYGRAEGLELVLPHGSPTAILDPDDDSDVSQDDSQCGQWREFQRNLGGEQTLHFSYGPSLPLTIS